MLARTTETCKHANPQILRERFREELNYLHIYLQSEETLKKNSKKKK